MKALHGLLVCLLMCLLLADFCNAQEASSLDLQRRADQASGVDCARFSMQVARQSMEDANRFFSSGDLKSAHKAVDDSLHYVARSVDCSLTVRKSEKATEIDLRRLLRRTKDILQTLDSEDRPHLARSVIEMEQQRDRLLHEMFGAAAGGTEKKP
jgi:hypothetical protein